MNAKDFYNVAVYLRLSRDDAATGSGKDIDGRVTTSSGKTESNSISSQRDMIRSYIRQHDDMEIYDIYVDDGWSGANFDRPAFKRMMEDIEAGKIDCVIVKDLSRLGRDYIEAGRLIQKTFPAFCVRFIALTDNFDSLTADHNEKSLVLPVKNFVNDSYCRDISQKVRSQQKVKRENGEFIGSFAVYGYRKSDENKNQLVPDDYAADIVRKIFAWRIEGLSSLAIADQLNNLGILSPMEYKKSKGERYSTGFNTTLKAKWSSVAVKRILVNETYIGTLVQGKEEKLNHKIKKSIVKPESEWTKVANTHEPIISKEDFEIVKNLMAVDCRALGQSNKSHMYTGLLFCGDCNEQMVRRVNKYKGKEKVYFICGTKNNGAGCTRHSTEEEVLNQIVLTGIRQQISLFMDKSNVLNRINQLQVNFEEVVAFDREIEKLHKEQDKYLSLRAGLYEDLKENIITEEDFRNFREIYEQQYNELNQAIKNQEDTIKKLFKSGISAGVQLERMKEALQITELDRDTLVTFVSKILVYEDKRVYLEMRHKELFSKAIMLAEFVEQNQQSQREVV
ncbi:recombinase family protein [Anaerosporobacter sp.]|uniref:recombinase family protein n=1 Tax=Anaerosporobacter sp. TaxID=1872529 RepID=UPI00286F41A0|nr:recombinase family protein [Anaerosporobacter sp.]